MLCTGPGYYLCSIVTTSAPCWPLATLLHTSEFPGPPPGAWPALGLLDSWLTINITAREDTLQVKIKNIFKWKVIEDFYEINSIKYLMNVILYFEAMDVVVVVIHIDITVYRVAGLSCPEAEGCKSTILRGFPDVFSLFVPYKVVGISFRYSWTTGMT